MREVTPEERQKLFEVFMEQFLRTEEIWEATHLENREQRFEAISAFLTKRNLRPLPKLGDSTKGETEILGVSDVYEDAKPWFTDVRFDVRFANGKLGKVTIRFNANGLISDGAVIVVLVNGKFAIAKQWRHTLGRWTYEFPRGFGEKLDQAKIAGTLGTLKIGDLPLGTLTRELGEEVMKSAEITSVTHLGNLAQNTGTDAVVPSVFMIAMTIPEDQLATKLRGSEDDIKIHLWDMAEVRREIGKRLLDGHTLAALCLALEFFARMPKMS